MNTKPLETKVSRPKLPSEIYPRPEHVPVRTPNRDPLHAPIRDPSPHPRPELLSDTRDPSQTRDPSTRPTLPSETQPELPSETRPELPSETRSELLSETRCTLPSETRAPIRARAHPRPELPSETGPEPPSETRAPIRHPSPTETQSRPQPLANLTFGLIISSSSKLIQMLVGDPKISKICEFLPCRMNWGVSIPAQNRKYRIIPLDHRELLQNEPAKFLAPPHRCSGPLKRCCEPGLVQNRGSIPGLYLSLCRAPPDPRPIGLFQKGCFLT